MVSCSRVGGGFEGGELLQSWWCESLGGSA